MSEEPRRTSVDVKADFDFALRTARENELFLLPSDYLDRAIAAAHNFSQMLHMEKDRRLVQEMVAASHKTGHKPNIVKPEHISRPVREQGMVITPAR